MSTSQAPAAIAHDAMAQVYDARTGVRSERVGAEFEAGDTFIDEGWVSQVTSEGLHVRGLATSTDLAEPPGWRRRCTALRPRSSVT